MAISQEQVFAAAQALQEADKEPTVRTIREQLGETGSFGTISRYLKEWKAIQQEQASIHLEEIPAEIREGANQLLKSVWHSASEWVNQEVSVVKQTAEVRVKGAEVQTQEALAEVETLEEQVRDLEQSKQALTAQLEGMMEDKDACSMTLKEAQFHVEQLQQRN